MQRNCASAVCPRAHSDSRHGQDAWLRAVHYAALWDNVLGGGQRQDCAQGVAHHARQPWRVAISNSRSDNCNGWRDPRLSGSNDQSHIRDVAREDHASWGPEYQVLASLHDRGSNGEWDKCLGKDGADRQATVRRVLQRRGTQQASAAGFARTGRHKARGVNVNRLLGRGARAISLGGADQGVRRSRSLLES